MKISPTGGGELTEKGNGLEAAIDGHGAVGVCPWLQGLYEGLSTRVGDAVTYSALQRRPGSAMRLRLQAQRPQETAAAQQQEYSGYTARQQ